MTSVTTPLTDSTRWFMDYLGDSIRAGGGSPPGPNASLVSPNDEPRRGAPTGGNMQRTGAHGPKQASEVSRPDPNVYGPPTKLRRITVWVDEADGPLSGGVDFYENEAWVEAIVVSFGPLEDGYGALQQLLIEGRRWM